MKQMKDDLDWIEEFYLEMDGEKRQILLQDHFSEPKTETDFIRERLWIARYGKRKPRKKTMNY